MKVQISRIQLTCLIGLFLATVTATYAQTPTADSTSVSRDSLSVLIPTEEELSISELTIEIEEAYHQLHKIGNELLMGIALTDIVNEFPDFSASVNVLAQTIQKENLELFELDQLENKKNILDRYDAKLQAWQNQTLNKAEKLSQHKREVKNIQESFSGQRNLLQDTTLTPLFQDRLTDALNQAETINEKIHEELMQVIALQNNIADLQIVINNYLDDIEFNIIHYQINLTKRDAPPFWRLATSTDKNSFVTQFAFTMDQGKAALLNYLAVHKAGIYWQLCLFIILFITLYTLKGKAYDLNDKAQIPHLERILYVFDRPWASALLTVLILTPLVYLHPPTILIQLFFVLMLIPLLAIVQRRKQHHELMTVTLISLAYFLSELEVILLGQSLGQRMLLLLAALIALSSNATFLYQTYKNPGPYPRFFRWLLFSFIGIFAIAAMANLLGYVALSSMLVNATCQSSIFGVLIFIAYRILCVIILLIIYSTRVQQSRMIKENQKVISENLTQIIGVLAGLYWIGTTLMHFNIYDYIYALISDFLLEIRTIGSIEFSIWSIIIFLIVVWASVTISKLIKYLLEQQYLSNTGQESKKGPMILLIRYFILLFGFFIAIAAAGIPLDKITIILGALSVGIGFGLQNIINNLVSGFILAVERPVQTGDIIEVGTNKGVVKDIGIRSSTVRTFDGSEVIIPNANFISDEVTNWTLSNKHRRIEVLVGVAYGNNPQQVMEILKNAVENQDGVLSVPQPMALFHGFGDNSLDFRLLFWISNMDNWLRLRSNVMEAVYQLLEEANIEIPFPQRDLHIKSGMPEMNGQKKTTTRKAPARTTTPEKTSNREKK